MLTSVIGYPRIGAQRELKFAVESYLAGRIGIEALEETASALRREHWLAQRARGIDLIPSGDFSYYDGVLDTAVLFGIVPDRYQALGLSAADTYFAMARGYQGPRGDVKALAMKKWFNTNYHYLVPEIEEGSRIRLAGTKPFDEFAEAKRLGIAAKPVLTGAFTLLKLAKYADPGLRERAAGELADAYGEALRKFAALGAEWVQLDEPCLVTDLSAEDLELFRELYGRILAAKGPLKALVQTYFGDVRDGYETLLRLPFDGIGLDFVEGRKSLALVERHGFPADKTLFAGVVNGKNIWRNEYGRTAELVRRLRKHAPNIALGTSCSLLHVPYTVQQETKLPADVLRHLAFAEEKLEELADLKTIVAADAPARRTPSRDAGAADALARNAALFAGIRCARNEAVRARVANLAEDDFRRSPAFAEREAIQKAKLSLPPLPTTTIGSFPQTPDVRANRAAFKRGEIDEEQYKRFNLAKIEECIRRQEEIGLDVLVHGEYERNDMVEYFGEQLEGFLFTAKAWVQSYGTRCVKPPIIWGDVARTKPITVEYAAHAARLTDKPVKGMLTGPVTILNWSFPREDIPLREIAFQIALAIRDEVLDLEANGIGIIQIDEAALREKLPLRRADWQEEYLSWAIPAFRLTHSGVRADTQIHTHMCYSQFGDMLREIDEMDADVVTFEASRSDLAIVDELHRCGFRTQVGPGVYDIHSPRIPGADEIRQTVGRLLERIPPGKLWINPDCGLKTRGEPETWASLRHLVQAAREARRGLQLG